MKTSRFTAWLPALLWALAIFYLSSIPLDPATPPVPTATATDTFSPQPTPRRSLPGGDTLQSAAKSPLPLNEIFHIVEFAGFYFWVAFALQRPAFKLIPQLTNRQTAIALAIAITYLFFDEVHQIRVPGRNFELKDVLFDLLGVLLMMALLKLIAHWFQKQGFSPS